MANSINSDFWQGKRVFVTGHTGFKGSWLSLWLLHMGAEVVGYALSPQKHSLFNQLNLANSMSSTIGDVRDLSGLQTCINNSNPEIVFHLAAQPLVRYSYQHPVETFHTNIMGTVNLLESLRNVSSVKATVIVTSDKCYQNTESEKGYVESDHLGGDDPYSSSKACAELVTHAYRHSFFSNAATINQHNAIATARAGNVIGGGDWAEDRIMPDMIASLQDETPILIRNPESIRPWQFVLEPLRGYLMLAESLFTLGKENAEAWNFGPNQESHATVQDLVDTIIGMWGSGYQQIQPGNHPHEAKTLTLNATKAKQRLGWVPKMTLNTTLEFTLEWYLASAKKQDMRAFSLNQLQSYLSLIE